MTDPTPLSVEVWTKDYVRKGVIGRLESASGMIQRNGPGSFEFTIPSDHRRVANLTEDGARAVVRYRHRPGDPLVELISGPVDEISGSGPVSSATRTFKVRDDWSILNEILGLPNPSGTMAQQGDDSAYFTRKGPAETVVKQIVEPNARHQGVKLTVPASAGRGRSCEVSVRMHPLADRLFPTVDQAGVLVRVIQRGPERVLEVTEPVTRPRVLTEGSGVIVDGSFQLTPAGVTRVIVGAGGEGQARVFREYVSDGVGVVIRNPPAGLQGVEKFLGYSRAAFVDARDVEATDAALEDTLQARALETLTEGAPKTSLQVTLAETRTFRFGQTYELGDQVSIRLAGSPVLTDYVRTIQFALSTGAGLTITPTVGDWAESQAEALYRSVQALAKAARDNARR